MNKSIREKIKEECQTSLLIIKGNKHKLSAQFRNGGYSLGVYYPSGIFYTVCKGSDKESPDQIIQSFIKGLK